MAELRGARRSTTVRVAVAATVAAAPQVLVPMNTPSLSRRGLLASTGCGLISGLVPSHASGAGSPPAFRLGVQYYRAPFPHRSHWADDLKAMKDAGLNTVQLWVLWSWVEAKPGRFVFDDYDRLVDLVQGQDLQLVISTIAELHPYWIHRVVRGSEMIDHTGRQVISSNRSEANFGLTPGGCFDHPGVRARMQSFITAVVKRYAKVPHLSAWDIWNETRWEVQADGMVCFCPHTLAAFRKWLGQRHGGLAGLNQAWQRRYQSWEEVMPGRLPRRPYTELMSWHRFITERANQHAQWRYRLVRQFDDRHPATLHGPATCVHHQGNIAHPSVPLQRGNDWAFADSVDGVGSSVFPTWWGMDDAAVGVLATHVKSAAGGKKAWLSEVQGGRAAQGLDHQDPVTPAAQQRWLWNAVASGIDTVLFWCWRDEVFGGESAGYGLVGRDGFAEARVAALRESSRIFEAQRALVSGYQPTAPQVGVLFSPSSYYLHWAQTGAGYAPRYAVEAYARALTKQSIPWKSVEEDHLDALDGLKLLIAPRVTALSTASAKRISQFVRAGGVLLCESEFGAFDELGFYREPPERMLAQDLGIEEVGRRSLGTGAATGAAVPTGTLRVPKGGPIAREMAIPIVQWVTPARAAGAVVWAAHADGALVMERQVDAGRVIYVGSYPGDASRDAWSADFETFVDVVVRRAGVEAPVVITGRAPTKEGVCFVRTGQANGRNVAFVFAPVGQSKVSLAVNPRWFGTREVTDLLSKRRVSLAEAGTSLKADVPLGPWGMAILH